MSPGDAEAAAPGLVIFDCDGVLVDSEGISMRTLTGAIASIGGTLGESAVRAQFLGLPLAEIERQAGKHVGGQVPAGWLDGWLAARTEAFERELTAISGAREAIEGVRTLGWETCIASGGRLAKMQQTLRLAGLADCFAPDRIFSATMVAHGKPAPDLFLHAAAACDVAPARCVVIEDSVVGVRGAQAAGMRVIGYAPPGSPDAAMLAGLGAELLDDMHALPARLAG